MSSPESASESNWPRPTIFPLRSSDRERIFDVPASLHPLVGRDSLLRDVCDRIRDPNVRLLTLTGPGGVGKTRIAQEAATALADAYDRVHFIPFASVNEPDLLLPTIARAVGAGDVPPAGLVQHLAERIRDQRTLLVLDNLEQIISAGHHVTDLIAATSRLDVLVTSRELLRVRGEHEAVLPCMTVPSHNSSLEDLRANESVALFLTRVNRFDPDFALSDRTGGSIAAICQRLDGLPLAIELAAARVKVLSLPALLDHLTDHIDVLAGGPRDQLEHQRTMRGTIDWSYRLLSAEEQALFRRLSVFSTSFSLDAVAAVRPPTSEAHSSALDELEYVHSLVDKSLVRRLGQINGKSTFVLLMTIRSFARDLARQSGEEEILSVRHAAWCSGFVAQSLTIPPSAAVAPEDLNQIDRQFVDIQRALAWYEKRGDGVALLTLATHLTPYWTHRSFRVEGCRWLASALDMPVTGESSPKLRAEALLAAASLSRTTGDFEQAIDWATDALDHFRQINDRLGMASSLNLLGVFARARGDFVHAKDLCSQSLIIVRELDLPWWIAMAQCNLGVISLWQGETRDARQRLDDAVRGFRVVDDRWGISFSLHALSLVRCAQGDARAAAVINAEAIQLAHDIGATEIMIDAIAASAVISVASGAFEQASTLLHAVQVLSDRIDYRFEQPELAHYAAAAYVARQAIGDDRDDSLRIQARGVDLTTMIGTARDVLSGIATNAFDPLAQVVTHLPHGASTFTAREFQVLALMARRYTDKEIASVLFISPRTVSRHVSNIFDKLGVHSRREVATLLAESEL